MMRFSLFLLVRVFMAIAITHGLLINQKSALLPKKQQSLSNRSRQINTSLNLDLFGFGPAEIGVVVVVGLVLFGPSKVKEQLRDSGVSSSIVMSDDPKTAKEQRIRDMQKYAIEKRKQRAWERINVAIENDDEDVLERMEQFNNKK